MSENRLPTDRVGVLVYCEGNKCYYTAYREKDKWWIFGTGDELTREVSSWRSLDDIASQSLSLEEARKEIERWRNDEASVCPEDVGFVEYIGALEKEIAALKSGERKLPREVARLTLQIKIQDKIIENRNALLEQYLPPAPSVSHVCCADNHGDDSASRQEKGEKG